MNGDQGRDAGAAQIFGAHRVARALRCDHEDVQIGTRLDQLEVDVQAVGKRQRGAFASCCPSGDRGTGGLAFVRRQHHDDIGPCSGVGRAHDLEAVASAFLALPEPSTQRDGDFLDAAVAQVQCMGVALAAVADDGDFLALIRFTSASRS